MNSGAKKITSLGVMRGALMVLCLSAVPALAQEETLMPLQGSALSKSVSESALPNPADVAGVAKAAAEGMGADKGTDVPALPAPSTPTLDAARFNAIELLGRLKAGDSGKPLSLAELAAVNDAMKRLEFMSQIETKISELRLSGGTSAPVAMPAPRTVTSMSGAVTTMPAASTGEFQILQISGSKGVYKALLASGGQTVYVRVGDVISSGTIASISLSGVKVSTGSGLISLPFKSQSAGLLR